MTANTENSSSSDQPHTVLSWSRGDIEQKLGFSGGRFTRVNTWLSILIAVSLTIVFYGMLIPLKNTSFARMFTDRGPTPYFVCFFAAWSLAILFIKWRKLRLQRRARALQVVPTDRGFVLSPATAENVMTNVQMMVDDPLRFVLFNRIHIALSNLKNIGRISDVDEILRSQAEYDESQLETSYSLLSGFVWAIPVLGFIGTVVGLSQAIGGFGNVLQEADDVAIISDSLRVVTGGLSTAFETTLVALVAALGVHVLVVFLRKSEEEFLDECSEYCLRNIVNRLKILPFESDHD